MSNKSKKIASDVGVSRASILLLFKDGDAVIARNWQKSDKPDDIANFRIYL